MVGKDVRVYVVTMDASFADHNELQRLVKEYSDAKCNLIRYLQFMDRCNVEQVDDVFQVKETASDK